MRFQASLADSCIGTRKRKEFFPGREMLRARYKNVNRVLTGEIGINRRKGTQGESQTFLSTILHVFNVVHLGSFLSRTLAVAFCCSPAAPFSSGSWPRRSLLLDPVAHPPLSSTAHFGGRLG